MNKKLLWITVIKGSVPSNAALSKGSPTILGLADAMESEQDWDHGVSIANRKGVIGSK